MYISFDIMIDDGCHEIHANTCSFENSIHKLKPNGVYIIEDIHPSQEDYWKERIKIWTSKYNVKGKWMEISNPDYAPYDYFVVLQKNT